MTTLTAPSPAAIRIGAPGTFTKTGWIPPADLDFDEWVTVGDTLHLIEKTLRLWWGDWLNAGEDRFPDRYTQALDASQYKYGSLANAAWITRKVPSSLRSELLGIGHYQEVAPLKTMELRAEWLARAIDEGLTVRQLKEEIKSSNSHAPQTILVKCEMCGGSGYLEKVV
jgi:hypothetical protein